MDGEGEIVDPLVDHDLVVGGVAGVHRPGQGDVPIAVLPARLARDLDIPVRSVSRPQQPARDGIALLPRVAGIEGNRQWPR